MRRKDNKLYLIIEKHGLSLIKDQSRCEALIRDYCIATPQELYLLLLALKNQIPLQLIEGKKKLPLTVKKLALKLQNKYSIKDDAAKNCVEHWVAGLGLISQIPQMPSPVKINLEMVLIPAGKFMMGSPLFEKGRNELEKQHEVTLTNSFYMGKYQVTQEQWESLMGKNPSTRTRGGKLPVTDVSWEDCQEFINKLNAKTKRDYRLPTEAEWEYACRAGTTTAYSYGDLLTMNDANFLGDGIKAVGSYKPNAFGLFDMHGNVWEWCSDWYGFYPEGPATDPKGPATGGRRVLRGGSFSSIGLETRSSFRSDNSPSFRFFLNGFRLVRTR
jgi:formylglycine-generating enzyme required for sulfatase activity